MFSYPSPSDKKNPKRGENLWYDYMDYSRTRDTRQEIAATCDNQTSVAVAHSGQCWPEYIRCTITCLIHITNIV